MKVEKSVFVESNTDYTKCPEPDKAEYAFIGRSNVGKSSLINMITGHQGLAKTSQKPGKTQLINHFLINDAWFLVDLPGYGWAQVSKTSREKWDKMVRDYLLKRPNLHSVFVLIDSRLEPQPVDREFMRWLAENGVPFSIVFTKTDKQSKTKTKSLVDQYIQVLLEEWEEVPPYFVTSATAKEGKEELLEYIDSLLKSYQPLA
jgi:GTP-binding protein